MMNIKLGLNFSKFHFEPKCKDEIQIIDTLTSIDGKYTICLGEDNLYRLVTDDPNAFMDLNIYKDMEFTNESARIRKISTNTSQACESYIKLERCRYPINFTTLSNVLYLLDYRKTVAERIKWDEHLGIELIEKINEDIKKFLYL